MCVVCLYARPRLYATSSEVHQSRSVGTTKCRTHYRDALCQNTSRRHVCIDDGSRYDRNTEGRHVLRHNLVRGGHVGPWLLCSSQWKHNSAAVGLCLCVCSCFHLYDTEQSHLRCCFKSWRCHISGKDCLWKNQIKISFINVWSITDYMLRSIECSLCRWVMLAPHSTQPLTVTHHYAFSLQVTVTNLLSLTARPAVNSPPVVTAICSCSWQ